MINTRRFVPLVSLVGVFVIAGLASTFVEQNQLPFFLLVSLIGLMVWIYAMGGGWRVADKDTVVIVKDFTHNAHAYEHGNYLYLPIINVVAAKLPTYSLYHEFGVDAIDTDTPKMAQIKKITVGVSYRIVDYMVCYNKSDEFKQRIKELEQIEKLQTDNPTLWIRVLNELAESIITDSIRSIVWHWAMHLADNPQLQLETPFTRSSPVEYDPYTLSLNRDKLSRKVKDEVCKQALKWGLVVKDLTFEKIELDQQIVDRATRNKDGEIAEATHQAIREAAAILGKGLAEAEVRAATVVKIIEALINQKNISVTDQMLYNIVRAAMYSDGQMIWNATMEKGGGGSSVKAA